MRIYLGNTEIGQIYLGSTEISEAYLGSDLVYDVGGVTPVLPYDAKVEYLEASGTQRIHLGTAGLARVVGSVQASLVQGSSALVIAARPNGSGAVWLGEVTTKRKWGIGSDASALSSVAPTTLIEFDLDFNSTGASGTINTSSVTRSSSTIADGEWSVFATTDGLYPFSGKVFYLKFYQNNNLVRDLIPVRVGQVGYLYDKASGILFGNVGTGDFILGNDLTT